MASVPVYAPAIAGTHCGSAIANVRYHEV